MSTDLADWLLAVSHGASHRSIARELGFQNGVLSRWVRTSTIPAHVAIDIARHYDADPIEGLCSAGYLTSDEVQRSAARGALQYAADVDIVSELHRRTLKRAVAAELARETLPSGVVAPTGPPTAPTASA